MKLFEQIYGVLNGMEPIYRAGTITLFCILGGIFLFVLGVQIGKAASGIF